MGDLKDTRLMWLKAALFLVIGALCAAGLLIENFGWRNALLLVLCVWSFCRFYYFCFHVLEKYVDGEFRFAGLFSVLIYLIKNAKKRRI